MTSTKYVIEFRWRKRRRWIRCVRQYDSLAEARVGVKKKFTDQKDADLYQTRKSIVKSCSNMGSLDQVPIE